MTIFLVDDTLQVDIFYACDDQDLEDNICIKVVERCPPEERLLCAGHTHIFLTPDQARQLGEMLLQAANHSEANGSE